MRRASIGFVALAACFTGDSVQGLPCSADEFCAGMRCIDGFCGGPPDGIESTSSTPTSSTTPTSTSIDPTPASTTDIDTTNDPTAATSTGSETTGDPPGDCVPKGCWDSGCFSLDFEDRFMDEGRPTNIAVARMDDDSLPDLVSTTVYEGTFALHLRRGIAGATFDDEPDTERTLAANPDYLAVGGLDSESHLDVVVVYQGQDQLSMFLWTGESLEPVGGAPQTTGTQPRLPVVMDIDGTGSLDVAYVVSEGIETFSSIDIDGAVGGLLPHSFYFDDLAAIEFGGAPALLGAHLSVRAGEATIYRPDPIQSELDELRFAQIESARLVAAADFDIDDDRDVVVVGEDGRIWKLPSFLDDQEGEREQIGSFQDMGAPHRFVLGQLDGECGLDLAVVLVNPGDQNLDVMLFRNEGATLSEGVLLDQPFTNDIAIAALGDDGIDELVLAQDAGYVQIARYFP